MTAGARPATGPGALTETIDGAAVPAGERRRNGPLAFARRHPTVAFGLALIAVIALVSVLAPHLGTVDPIRFSPAQRLRPPSDRFWFGTDSFGRDVYSRTIYGGRISLVIGFSVALLATTVGLAIGLVAGYLRTADAILMRLMDGLMAIPSILLAIAIIAITRASVRGVLLAIAIPEIPRVVRLVRGIVLTLREQPYVEATRGLGSGLLRILVRHLLPNTLAPLIVQATYICAVAILIEAALGFLGAGTPPEIPSWGNIMAEGRTNFQVGPWMILFPGTFLALVVLAVNLVGDGLRDLLDPRFARRL
jgi:peptide/nickel transport system permease protein